MLVIVRQVQLFHCLLHEKFNLELFLCFIDEAKPVKFNSPQILGLFIIQQDVIRGNVYILGHGALHIEYIWRDPCVSLKCVGLGSCAFLVQQIDRICRSRDIYGMMRAIGERCRVNSR